MIMVTEELRGFRKMYTGFTGARVILTANNLGVFDRLKRPVSAKDMSKVLKTDPRATEILLDALAGIGLLLKSRDGRYKNTAISRRYLVKGSRLYQGDIVKHASAMWENWSALDKVVRNGLPARRAMDNESFIMGMHNLTVLRTAELTKSIGLRGVKTMLDLGGGPGTNAISMAGKGVKATIFDLPATIKIAKKVARDEGVKGLKFISGDFHVNDIGSGYDLILLSQIFHAFSEKENRALLQKCRAALNPEGRVVIQEFPIDNTMTSPPHSALFSVNMLVATKDGRCYRPLELKEWLADAGYKRIKVKKLPETVLVEGMIYLP
jgi:ubiquinone/menaquinone biosynthesis C-methylase UbiE